MQTATYNIIDKIPVQLWRAVPAQITITGIEDTSGTWVFLLDNDWKDGALVVGNVTAENGNLVVSLLDLDNQYLANAINGKEKIQCKGTLTNAVNQCYLISITILNRTVNNAPAPTPATSYYTKAQTDTLLAEKADESELSNYLLKTGGQVETLTLKKDENTNLFTFNNGTTLYGYTGLLFYSSYSNSTNLVTTAQTTIQNDTVALSGLARVRLVSKAGVLSWNNHNQNTPGGICILDDNGNLIVPGIIETIGKENITLNSLTALSPKDNKIYIYNLLADSELTIDTTALTANNTVDFELHLIQGETPKAVIWPAGIKWGENGVFKASNTAPAINEANTLYAFSIRWNGSKLLINLAYSQER